ncbi:CBS domain-containing protein [Janthinobacterium sp. LB3P112]|uniref:CBS domain-containing protein n=1 Tax=Janthinobacterium sp. LB3P112 TaxID=3424196 RepID=UPI003F2976F1
MHIGDICTLHGMHCERVPIGILTDRDIVISVIALGLAAAILLMGDIMSAQLLTASEDEDAYDIIERRRVNGIRRLPVLNSLDALSGGVSIDDLPAFLAQEMVELARFSGGQLVHEERTRE